MNRLYIEVGTFTVFGSGHSEIMVSAYDDHDDLTMMYHSVEEFLEEFPTKESLIDKVITSETFQFLPFFDGSVEAAIKGIEPTETPRGTAIYLDGYDALRDTNPL